MGAALSHTGAEGVAGEDLLAEGLMPFSVVGVALGSPLPILLPLAGGAFTAVVDEVGAAWCGANFPHACTSSKLF